MKKLTNVLLAACLLLAGSCKNKEKTNPAERNITSYIYENDQLTVAFRSIGPWELGLRFSLDKPGKITELGSRMPDPGEYRVSIWDVETKSLLRQKKVEQTAPDQLEMAAIVPLEVTPEKFYVISISSAGNAGEAKRYHYARSNGASANFLPATQGSVTLVSSLYMSTSESKYPEGVIDIRNEVYGFPEFTFIPD